MEISSPGYSSLPVVNGDAQSNRSDQIITVEQKDRCHPEISVDPVAPDLQTRSESPWPHHEGFGSDITIFINPSYKTLINPILVFYIMNVY